jgi:hypothetical protein
MATAISLWVSLRQNAESSNVKLTASGYGRLSALSCLFTNPEMEDECYSNSRICCVHRGDQVEAHE